MEGIQWNNFGQEGETLIPDPLLASVLDLEKPLDEENRAYAMDEDEESSVDDMICNSCSSLIPSGFTRSSFTDEVVLFVNAGGQDADLNDKFVADKYFKGGDVFQTEECISEGGDFSFIYQSARLGSFSYQFDNLPPGDYFVDLHFVEIIFTNGPKGMRVFDVFIQNEKVLSNFDIFSIAGANKPLQLVGSRISVKDNGVAEIRFEGVIGSPVVSGICIRRAAEEVKHDTLICQNCAAEVELSSPEKKNLRIKSTAKYEKKIQDLNTQFQRKNDECHQAWMSFTEANEQLEKVKMELDNRLFQTYSLDQTVEKQAERLRDISNKYEREKKFWFVTVNELDKKIKMMKHEHAQLSREAHECADSVPELNKMTFAVQALVAQCEDLKVKYNEEQVKRRKLHNQVEEAKGNIRVFCRCRPLNKAEASAGYSTVVDFDTAKDGELGILSGGSTKKTFKFDRVYTPNDEQVDVYADASPMVTSVLDGYNVCIFAYGQTGTGKTFTMEGNEKNRGVNYRTLEELFKIAKARSDTFTYEITVSVLEVYNEQIRDLLATSPSSKKLEIKQALGSHHIPGIVEAKVENIKEVWNVLQAGSSARAVGSNNVNEHSSRSHCMLCIMVRAKNLISGECTKSKLWLVDLAGSERLAKTDAQGDRLKEAQNINRSLSALGDVISALANKSSHIPYRNSKLTHLLQDSLGGDSKTLMFVQISPSENDVSETLSSLNFAVRVRGVDLGPARKQVDTSEIQRLKQLLEKARHECKSKEEALRKLEESLQNFESKAKNKDQVYKNQIKELDGQLELKTSLQTQLEKQVSSLSERLKGKEEVSSNMQLKVKELEYKLREREQMETTTYQQKVKEIEDNLKAEVREMERHCIKVQQKVDELQRKLQEHEQNPESSLLRQKVDELERKLQEQQDQNSESSLLRQKIKELEEKVKYQEKLEEKVKYQEQHILDLTNSSRSSSTEGKCRTREDVEQYILTNSNSRETTNHRSVLPKEKDTSLHQVRKKRLSRNSDNENINTSTNTCQSRQSDPPKQFSRVARTPNPAMAKPVGGLAGNRTTREPVKERESKKRIWSR